MARGIQLAFTLNPRDFIKGLKQIEVDLEDVKDTLDDVEDAASDTFDDLDTGDAERGLRDVKDGLEDVERAAEDAEGAFGGLSGEAKSELGKVETAAQQAGAEVESELKDGAKDAEKAFSGLGSKAKSEMRTVENAADKAGDEVGEIEDEAAQSAKEFGASFRGDPVEALEEVQALTSELANKLIPGVGGAVLSIAGGIAFGALISFYERWKEEQERVTEQIREWRDATLDAFAEARDGLAREDVLGGFKDQLDEANVSVTDFLAAAEKAGPGIEQAFAKAFQTGAPEDFAAAQDLVAKAQRNLSGLVSSGQAQFQGQYDAVRTLTSGIGTYGDELLNGIDQAEAWAESVDGTAGSAGNALSSYEDLRSETEAIRDAHEEAADAVRALGDEFATAEEAADDYAAQTKDTRETVNELTQDGVQPLARGLGTQTEAAREGRESLRNLAESAQDAAAAQIELDGDTEGARQTVRKARQDFIAQATQLGLTRAEARKYADQLGLIPGDVPVDINVTDNGSVSATQSKIDNIQGKTVLIQVEALGNQRLPI